MTSAITAAEYWENRYRENGPSWSGRVNASLEREVGGILPGTALDLGSGEGGDALWLASKGWSVTAVDISPTALATGAAAQRPEHDITWIAADLATWQAPTTYDLVTSCFLHSTVELPREAILRRAAEAVAPGGILLTVGHSGVPHWPASHDGADGSAAHHHGQHRHHAPDDTTDHAPDDTPDHSPADSAADSPVDSAAPELPAPQQVLADLFDGNPRLTRSEWLVVTDALVERDFTAPDGSVGSITDSVLMLLRAGSVSD